MSDTILKERARRLALAPRANGESADDLELLEFRLADETYAIETRHVVEVHVLRDLTPLPGTPAFVRGIVNLRGHILPVFDLKKFFDLPERGLSDLHRIIVVSGADLEFGLLADTVTTVSREARANFATTLPTLAGIGAQYLLGVNERRLVVLDLDRILADPDIVVPDEVED